MAFGILKPKQCLYVVLIHPGDHLMKCITVRFGSTAKVLAGCKLKHYRISEYVCGAMGRDQCHHRG